MITFIIVFISKFLHFFICSSVTFLSSLIPLRFFVSFLFSSFFLYSVVALLLSFYIIRGPSSYHDFFSLLFFVATSLLNS